VSGGVYLNAGFGHFTTMHSDHPEHMRHLEPVIAHEMTHSLVSHLPIPAWLNEGLAVSVERKLTPYYGSVYSPEEMHRKHVEYWTPKTIQEFWSGKSFLKSGDSNLLSYDLGLALTTMLGADFSSFEAFALHANLADGGADASNEHLHFPLSHVLGAFLRKELNHDWLPHANQWASAPEIGRF
jgi:hypothetical protein